MLPPLASRVTNASALNDSVYAIRLSYKVLSKRNSGIEKFIDALPIKFFLLPSYSVAVAILDFISKEG